MKIQNGVFVITGGGSGLGAAAARLLVENGGKVVLADVNEQAGQALAKELGGNARFVKTDVVSEESVKNAVKTALDAFGGIHGAVSCAGIAPAEKVVGKEGVHKLETFMRAVNINLVGVFNMLRFAADEMVKAQPNADGERGVIINIASIAAWEAQMGQVAYGATKGGVVAMTLPAARDLARYGVRVMAIAPGLMETPMLLGMPENVQQALNAMVPFPTRVGKPNEFAMLVKHIIENPYLNGETIRLDGAMRMAAK